MGWDCTLHVFDASLVEAKLVPWVIGGGPVPEEIRGAFLEPDTVTAELHALLEDRDDPRSAAVQLGTLALMLSGEERDYLYSRDFAVGLVSVKYDEFARLVASELQRRFAGDVTPHFAPFVERWPHLAGAFPREIETNYMTGAFIPAGTVGAAHRWMKREIEPVLLAGPSKPNPEGFVDNVRSLMKILEICAAEGLPYWEGTEILGAPLEGDDQVSFEEWDLGG